MKRRTTRRKGRSLTPSRNKFVKPVLNSKGKKLILYERYNSRGEYKGYGWHTTENKKKLEDEGFKFIRAKN